MVKSMTGFGRSQINMQGYQVTCEIKSVNHRFLDPHIRISRRYSALEEKIKDEIKKYVHRGRIEVNINIEKERETERNIKLDKELALDYYNSLKELGEFLDIPQNLTVMDFLNLPEVFTLQAVEEDLAVVETVLDKSLQEALQGFVESRAKEGQNLISDISLRNQLMLKMVDRLEERSSEVTKEYAAKLRQRIVDLMNTGELDEQRIAQEAAIFADKSSITEEIVRLKSHVKHLDELIKEGDYIGRKCDFLVQEMFREINTVASKGNDLEISRIVVDAKSELEKIREQLQNIE